jgi:type VI secretion system protein ImpH
LGGVDRFSRFMMCMIGRGTAGMPTDRPIPPVKMLRYAGLLVQLPKSAAGLRGIVADYFRPTPVRVDQCRGRWLIVEDRNELGRLHTTLGEDAILGGRVFDRSGKIRLSLGPVDLESFMAFLPIGRAMERLKDLTRSYLLDELEFDVEIWLQGDQVPSIRLGSADPPALLGWTTWLVEGPGEDRSVVFDPDSAAAAARRERMLRDAQRAA